MFTLLTAIVALRSDPQFIAAPVQAEPATTGWTKKQIDQALVDQPKKLSEKIVAASMFKNGFAVLMREMDVPGSGDYLLERIPEASMGTLWFSTSDGAKLQSVVSTTVYSFAPVYAQSINDLLNLNVGKRVTLHLNTKDSVSGTLENAQGSLLILRQGAASTVIEKNLVLRVDTTDKLNESSLAKGGTRGLRFHIAAKGPAKIYMASLERGLTWSPAYEVTLKSGKTLSVVGKATVVDDLEAIDGIEARFITGWPNLPYANMRDPLVEVQQAVQYASGGFGGGGGGFAGGVGRGGAAFAFGNQAPAAMDVAGSMPMSDLNGLQSEDLFFYRQPDVHLKQGDRGYYIVLSMDAPYQDLYTWDIPDFVNDGQYAVPNVVAAPQETWHTIKFKNTSHVPFSTGPATIMKDGGIIGQDSTKYTPAGVDSELRITQSLDLSADQLEEEVSRDRGAIKNVLNQPTYDLVTLKGTLSLTSHKSEPVPVRIRKSVTGDVISTTPNAKVVRIARGLRDTNSHASLEWTDTIAPGKTLTLTYEYKVYIRS